MKIDADTVQLYLNNPSFSPALQTVMVEALESLRGVANRALFIKISLQANTPEMARTITEIATMTAGYHKNVAPLLSLSPFGRFLYATSKKGTAVVLFPADHVLWTATVASAATWIAEPVKGPAARSGSQLWILGDFSEKARTELQNLGWELHTNGQNLLLPEKK